MKSTNMYVECCGFLVLIFCSFGMWETGTSLGTSLQPRIKRIEIKKIDKSILKNMYIFNF